MEFTIRFGRPTLELMLASFSNNVVQELINSSKNVSSFNNLILYERSVGVTVFSYGIPLYVRKIQVRVQFLLRCQIKGVGTNSFKIEPIQLFCRHNAELDQWTTSNNERQFVMVASSEGLEYKTLSKLANQSLSEFDVLGLTWRDDIGLKADSILSIYLHREY